MEGITVEVEVEEVGMAGERRGKKSGSWML
jgi:hypothetical protein